MQTLIDNLSNLNVFELVANYNYAKEQLEQYKQLLSNAVNISVN